MVYVEPDVIKLYVAPLTLDLSLAIALTLMSPLPTQFAIERARVIKLLLFLLLPRFAQAAAPFAEPVEC